MSVFERYGKDEACPKANAGKALWILVFVCMRAYILVSVSVS